MLGQLVLRPHLNLGEGDALGHGGDQGLLLRDLVPQLADLLLTLGPFLFRETQMEMESIQMGAVEICKLRRKME